MRARAPTGFEMLDPSTVSICASASTSANTHLTPETMPVLMRMPRFWTWALDDECRGRFCKIGVSPSQRAYLIASPPPRDRVTIDEIAKCRPYQLQGRGIVGDCGVRHSPALRPLRLSEW